ncbi:MAG: glycoside hydrolase domain-containing protein [Candidatus Lutibacillus vidarii]
MTRRQPIGTTALAVAVLAYGAVPAAGASAGPTSDRTLQTVTYDGVAVRVPASWPVIPLDGVAGCVRYDRHAVYLGTPTTSTCPAHLVGHTETVQITRVTRSRADAIAGSTRPAGGADREILLNGDRLVAVTEGADPVSAAAIEASLAVAPPTLPSMPQEPASDAPTQAAPPPAITTTGGGFDTCAAPSTSQMRSWLASPYRSANVYIGGINRGCAQANLSAAWVTAVHTQGWRLIPTYVGLQASCAPFSRRIDPATAATQGTAAADDAANLMASLGLAANAGHPVYYDMEGYDITNSGCVLAVKTFVNAWTVRLHARGYVSGVYGSAGSLMTNLVQWSADSSFHLPDGIWNAHWDGRNTTVGDPYIPDALWPHRRVHQYRGDHTESYGGVTINIDNDAVDGATTGPSSGDRDADTVPDGGDACPAQAGPVGSGGCPVLAGESTSAVIRTAYGADPPTMDVYATNATSQLVHKWLPLSGGWLPSVSGVESLGSAVAGTPTTVLRPASGSAPPAVDVFYRTTSGGLGHQWLPLGGAWQPSVTGTELLGSGLASDPAAVVRPADGDSPAVLDVYATTTSGQLIHKWLPLTGAWTPSGTGVEVLASGVVGKPTAVLRPTFAGAPATMDVFYRTTTGALGHKWLPLNGTWLPSATGTELLGTGVLSSPSAVVRPAYGAATAYLDVFATSSTGALLHKWLPFGGSWAPSATGFEVLASGVAGVPAAALRPPYGGEPATMEVLYRTTSGGLGHKWFPLSGTWAPLGTGTEILGSGLFSPPFVVVRPPYGAAPAYLAMFAVTTSGALAHKWLAFTGAWAPSTTGLTTLGQLFLGAMPTPPGRADGCGTVKDTYTIPSVTGVDYLVGGLVKSAGTYAGVGTVLVTARAKTGYVLTGPASWTLSFTSTACSATVAGAPLSTPTWTAPQATLTWATPGAPAGTAITYDVQFRSVTLSPTGVRGYTTPTTWFTKTTTTTATLTGSVSGVYQVQARATDSYGTVGAWSPWFTVTMPVDDRATSFGYTGAWTAGSDSRYYSGTYRLTSAAGAKVTVTAWTDQVSVVGVRASTCGKATVTIDGVLQATIDAYGATAAYRQTLATITVPYGRHTITVTNLGTSGRPLLILDALAFRR